MLCNNYSAYHSECEDFHIHLLNNAITTLDNIPQYVRIIEGQNLYIAGYKAECYRNKDKKDIMPWLIDFVKLVNDDCVAVSGYKTLNQLSAFESMIYALDIILDYAEWDYGKNIRIALETVLEKSVLRTLQAFRTKQRDNLKSCIAKELSKSRT